MDNAANNVSPMQIGETREAGALRFHRYRESIKVTDLTNAGKRGQTVDEFHVGMSYAKDSLARLEDVCDAVLSATTYAEACAAAQYLANEAPSALHFSAQAFKSIAVQPAGFETISICNEHMCLTAGYDDFGISDLTDQANCPRVIPTCHDGKKTAVKRFYAYVKANREQLQRATFGEVWDGAQAAGVRTHYYCAND